MQFRLKGAEHARLWHLYVLHGINASFVTLLVRIAKARQDDASYLTTNRLLTVQSQTALPGFQSFHYFELAFGVQSLFISIATCSSYTS